MIIAEDDPLAEDAQALLEAHGAFATANSPPDTCHFLDPQSLAGPDMTFFTARENGALLGCVALKTLGEGRGEIKSMHVSAASRGRGVARALLEALIEAARARGLTWLGLETGRSDGFAPSRALYAAAGFGPCPPFGAYQCGTFSYCMSRELTKAEPRPAGDELAS